MLDNISTILISSSKFNNNWIVWPITFDWCRWYTESGEKSAGCSQSHDQVSLGNSMASRLRRQSRSVRPQCHSDPDSKLDDEEPESGRAGSEKQPPSSSRSCRARSAVSDIGLLDQPGSCDHSVNRGRRGQREVCKYSSSTAHQSFGQRPCSGKRICQVGD